MADKARLIARILDAQRRIQHLLAYDRSNPLFDSNLTLPQLKILLVLSLRGDASGQELSRVMGVGLATMTGIVDRLAAQNLVARRQDPRDRRVRRVELTESGRQLIDGIITAGIERQQRILKRLTVDDLRTVERAARLMADAATAEFAANPPSPHDLLP